MNMGVICVSAELELGKAVSVDFVDSPILQEVVTMIDALDDLMSSTTEALVAV